jgi:hypothetical protein
VEEIVDNGVKSFSATFDFSDLDLPGSANVYVEPYFKSTSMRFDFGVVSNIVPPASTALVDIPPTDRLLYRIKVVDASSGSGLVLGFADKIRPETLDKPAGRTSLLPVDFNDLGNRIWKLDFREEGPVLSVNHAERIEQIREIVQSPWFRAVVYPEIVRQIVNRLLTDKDISLDEPSGWAENWLRFFREVLLYNIDSIPDTDDVREVLVEEVVDTFCRKHELLKILAMSYANPETK